MRREIIFSLIALALLAAAGVAVALPVGLAEVPLRASLETVPDILPGWAAGSDAPAGVLPPDTRAPNRLVRGYASPAGPVWVMVEYFPSQDETRRAAAREFVFPGAGWSQIAEREVTVSVPAADGRGLEANLVVVEAGGRRYAIAYWYQIGPSAVASDHWYRARLLYNRLVRGRSDGALVRMASPLASGEDSGAALDRQAEFLRVFYPALLRSLPR
jgi:EpsI family protein